MNKRASNGGRGIVFVQVIVLAGFLMIGLLSTPAGIVNEYEKTYGEYTKVVNSYNDLRNRYLNTVNSCLSTPEQCLTMLDQIRSTLPSTDLVVAEKANSSAWRSYSGVVLILLFGVISLAISGVQLSQFKNESKEREKQFESEKKREIQRSLEEGRRETIKSLALELVSDKDVISELTVWLSEYKSREAKREKQQSLREGRGDTIKSLSLEFVSDKDTVSELTKWLNEYISRVKQQSLEEGRRDAIKSLAQELVSDQDIISELTVWLNEYKSREAKIDQSAYIHSQILTRLVKQIHLNPISKLNDVVKFDPAQHRTYDRLISDEEAIVVEPGWRVGREIVKLPLVRRKS